MSPPAIAVLPNELLDAVAAHLDHGSLKALALVCKFTNPSATDALYKSYVNRKAPSKAPFSIFLRTLCERPDLAAKVRIVSVHGWRAECEVSTGAGWRGITTEQDDNYLAKPNVHGGPFTSLSVAKTFPLFVEAAVKAGLIAKRESYPIAFLKINPQWYTTLKADRNFLRLLGNGVEDAQILLMLALLPRLEMLRIDGLTPYPTLDWHHFLSRSTTALRTVKYLCLQGSPTTVHEPVVWSTLQMLDLLPCLETFHLLSMNTSHHQYSSNVLPSNKLKHVSLGLTGIQRQLLQKILAGQKNIRTFRYLPSPWSTYGIPGRSFSGEVIEKYLSTSQNSLRDLTFFPTAPSRRTNLRIFKNLTSLEVPWLGLEEISKDEEDVEVFQDRLREHIPESLATLTLRFLTYTPQLKIWLKVLAQLKLQGEFASLRLLNLRFKRLREDIDLANFGATTWFPVENPEPLLRAEFGGLLEKAGLQLDISLTD